MFNKTKDKVADVEDAIILEPFSEFAKNRFDDIKRRYKDADKYFDISKKVDEMSRYSTIMAKDEYEILYLKDTTYARLIKEREMFTGILEEFITEVKSDSLNIDERLVKIIYVKENLQPILDDLDNKINERKDLLDENVKQFIEDLNNKKNIMKNVLYGVAVLGAGAVCLINPKAREGVQAVTKAIGKSK